MLLQVQQKAVEENDSKKYKVWLLKPCVKSSIWQLKTKLMLVLIADIWDATAASCILTQGWVMHDGGVNVWLFHTFGEAFAEVGEWNAPLES